MGLHYTPVRIYHTKFSSDGKRVLRGVASTGSVDRQGDVLDPMGATYKLPLPLLAGHDHAQPIGWVREINATPQGLHVVCEVVSGIPRADAIWAEIEKGLIQNFSVGFIPLQSTPIKTGTLYSRFEVIELSCVVVPANADCRITATRSTSGVIRKPVSLTILRDPTR